MRAGKDVLIIHQYRNSLENQCLQNRATVGAAALNIPERSRLTNQQNKSTLRVGFVWPKPIPWPAWRIAPARGGQVSHTESLNVNLCKSVSICVQSENRRCRVRSQSISVSRLKCIRYRGGPMNTKSEIPPTQHHPSLVKGILMRFGVVMFFLVLQAVILFLASGRLTWAWAWAYLGICLVSLSINGTILLRTSPETVAERGRPGQTQAWDKLVGGLWGVALFLVLPLVAGLDVRFGWTQELGAGWHVAGAVVLAAGLGLSGWAMIANAYFSTAVRIQSDRGQTVCRSGPYGFVRHPGYLGFILQSPGTSFVLGSLWALIPGTVAAALMVIRTSLEDRMLQAELPGYGDFVQEVHYRLFPGIW